MQDLCSIGFVHKNCRNIHDVQVLPVYDVEILLIGVSFVQEQGVKNWGGIREELGRRAWDDLAHDRLMTTVPQVVTIGIA